MQIKIDHILKQLRSHQHYTQDFVARKIGVKQRTYQAYEEGRAIPPVHRLLDLVDLYCLSGLDDFLGVEKSKKIDKLVQRYKNISPDKRKIIDFILDGEC